MTTTRTTYDLHDFGEAYEAFDGQDFDAFLHEWTERLGLPRKRQAFPADFDGDHCPHCGAGGAIQYRDLSVHWWDFQTKSMAGRLVFDGSFDYDDGSDDHIACWSCGTEWTVPAEGVDFT